MSAEGYVLLVHGGAGRAPDSPGWRDRARAGMADAALAGGRVLREKGGALDAVVAAVRVLEANPAFNAGLGSVCNRAGEVEMDAAVMRGDDLGAGAVAGLRTIRHPIEAARRVLDEGTHLLFAGTGAEQLAARAGLERIDPAALRAAAPAPRVAASQGTVGAVALDRAGHLAAATSTGGTPGKQPGRVSDSALIGAGTYADDATCAVSTTGHGESFMRCVFAHAVAAALCAGRDLEEACEDLLGQVARLGGEGGCIALDRQGNAALPFDTPVMPRAALREAAPDDPEIAL